MYEIKTKDVMKILVRTKKCLIKSKYGNSNKLVVGEMNEETGGVVIKGFVGLKPKMHLHLVDDSSEHKKAKGVNRNIVARIRHGVYIYIYIYIYNILYI